MEIIKDLNDASAGLLLWRSILQWLGGIGIIVMAVAALPLLHISGLQLFFSEQTEGTDKLKESVKKIATSIIIIYGALTIICAVFLKIVVDAWDLKATWYIVPFCNSLKQPFQIIKHKHDLSTMPPSKSALLELCQIFVQKIGLQ